MPRIAKYALYGAIMAVTVDYVFSPTIRKSVGIR